MTDLDSLFAGRGRPIAVQTFTDRQRESSVFAEAIHEQLERLASESVDFDGPRSNLVVFYGVGGQGKTTLSERLERWIAGDLGSSSEWGAPPAVDRRVITTRVELHENLGLDIEQAALRLRASIGSTGVSVRTFDHAFALWWPAYHASDDVPSVPVRQFSFLPVRGVDVGGQIRDSVISMVENAGVAFGVPQLLLRVGERLRDALRRRAAESAISADPVASGLLNHVIENPGLGVLAALPYLMSFDLREADPEERPLWIVFVDGFEHLNGDTARRAEADFQRMVVSLPDALWVVTGRLRLDWADDSRLGALPRIGAAQWPGLAAIAHRSQQHQVGELASDDIHRFLSSATARLPVEYRTSEVFSWIADRSAGWPLYLDHAVKRLAHLTAERVVPTRELVDISFSDLVWRITHELSPEERDALYWSAVCPRFSPALLVAASGRTVMERTVDVLRARGLVRSRSWEDFELSLHDSLRDQLRKVATTAGGWTRAEWQDAAASVVQQLHHQYTASSSPTERTNCLALAAATALDGDVPADWLVLAAPNLPLMELASQAMPPIPADRNDSWVAHLAAVLGSWRSDSPSSRRWQRLEAVIAERDLPPNVRAMAERFRAYSYRNHGDERRCLEIFERLVAEGARGELTNRRQLAIARLRMGAFGHAEVALRDAIQAGLAAEGVAGFYAVSCRRRGDLVSSERHILGRLEKLQEKRRFRMSDESLTDLLEVRALGPEPDLEEIDSIGQKFEESGNTRRILAVRFARALAHAGRADFSVTYRQLEDAYRLPPPGGDSEHELQYRIPVTLAFDAAVRGNSVTTAARSAEVTGHVLWRAVTRLWSRIDDPAAIDDTGIDWGEPGGVVLDRWRDVVWARRRALGMRGTDQ